MTETTDAEIVDLRVVFTDDGVVETLRNGHTPPSPGPLTSLLGRWRDLCRTGTDQAA